MKARVPEDWERRLIRYLKEKYGRQWEPAYYEIKHHTKVFPIMRRLVGREVDIVEEIDDIVTVVVPEGVWHDKSIFGISVPRAVLEILD